MCLDTNITFVSGSEMDELNIQNFTIGAFATVTITGSVGIRRKRRRGGEGGKEEKERKTTAPPR